MNKIAFIGAGNMNSAIISGILNQGFAKEQIIVTDLLDQQREKLAEQYDIAHTSNNVAAAQCADFIILGVKPHHVTAVCQEIAENIDVSGKCFISIAAGLPIEKIASALGNNEKTSIIRVMPNTPAQLGLGVHGAFCASNVTDEQKKTAGELLAATGVVKWLATEDDIDNITAVSGSGPAYFFLFMEAMQKQAQAFGFSEQDSREIVQQTALGAAKMVIENKDTEISQLRENVTSKGGTTQAALNCFNENNLIEVVEKSMVACLARAKEMANEN